jgi:hypothetical protein
MNHRFTVAQIVLLAAWLGAVGLFGGIVAPAAFAALPSRSLAGAVVGRVLPAIFVGGMLLGLFVTTAALLGGRAIGRSLLGAALVLSCAISHLVIGARIDGLRRAIGPSLDALAPGDSRRLMFGKLHALSVAGLGIGTLAAAAALWLAVVALRRELLPRAVHY